MVGLVYDVATGMLASSLERAGTGPRGRMGFVEWQYAVSRRAGEAEGQRAERHVLIASAVEQESSMAVSGISLDQPNYFAQPLPTRLNLSLSLSPLLSVDWSVAWPQWPVDVDAGGQPLVVSLWPANAVL